MRQWPLTWIHKASNENGFHTSTTWTIAFISLPIRDALRWKLIDKHREKTRKLGSKGKAAILVNCNAFGCEDLGPTFTWRENPSKQYTQCSGWLNLRLFQK